MRHLDAQRTAIHRIEFVRARLSPRGYFDLELTLGVVVLVGASWLFGGVTEDVLHGDPLTIVDQQVATWFDRHSEPAMTVPMWWIGQAHNTLPVSAFAIGLAFVLCGNGLGAGSCCSCWFCPEECW